MHDIFYHTPDFDIHPWNWRNVQNDKKSRLKLRKRVRTGEQMGKIKKNEKKTKKGVNWQKIGNINQNGRKLGKKTLFKRAAKSGS